MKRLATQPLFALFLFFRALASGAQEPKALPLPDERYKADILLVVAIPMMKARPRRILRVRSTNINE